MQVSQVGSFFVDPHQSFTKYDEQQCGRFFCVLRFFSPFFLNYFFCCCCCCVGLLLCCCCCCVSVRRTKISTKNLPIERFRAPSSPCCQRCRLPRLSRNGFSLLLRNSCMFVVVVCCCCCCVCCFLLLFPFFCYFFNSLYRHSILKGSL